MLTRIFVFEVIPQMARTTTMTVRLSGALSDFVSENVGETGSYENASEYIRDLIRRDKERAEREAFERLQAELKRAYAAPDSSFHPLSASDVIARNQAQAQRMTPVRVQESASPRIDEIYRYSRNR